MANRPSTPMPFSASRAANAADVIWLGRPYAIRTHIGGWCGPSRGEIEEILG
jgi:hypothetical protein